MQDPKMWLLLAAGTFPLLMGSPAGASSHADAPLIAEDPKADNTDVYFFRSPQDPSKAIILANFIPLQEPSAGPTYHYFSDEVRYEIHVDRNGDATPDLTYQFEFQTRIQANNTFLSYLGPISTLTTDGRTTVNGNNVNRSYNRFQTYNVVQADLLGNRQIRSETIARGVLVPPNNAGPTTIPDYPSLIAQATHTIPGKNLRVFAGQVDDPFFLDLGAIFDLFRVRPFRTLHALQAQDPRPNRTPAPDMLSGYNVHTIALEVPITTLTGTTTIPSGTDPRRVVGVYSSASRRRVQVLRQGFNEPNGPFVVVSRLGSPLVNELFNPLIDSQRRGRTRDEFNRVTPARDEQFRFSYEYPEPALRLAQLYPALRGIIPNVNCDAQGNCSFAGPRNDLLGGATPLLDFIPDYLRLDVSVPVSANPNRLGVIGGDMQGFPNGRRLTDDVVDIYFRVAAGVLVPGNVTFNGQSVPRATAINSLNLGDGVDNHENGRFGYAGTFPFAGPAHPGVLPAHIGFDDPEKEQERP